MTDHAGALHKALDSLRSHGDHARSLAAAYELERTRKAERDQSVTTIPARDTDDATASRLEGEPYGR